MGKDTVMFTDRTGEPRTGYISKEYQAFEGETRYVITDDVVGTTFRCVKKNGKFVELVV